MKSCTRSKSFTALPLKDKAVELLLKGNFPPKTMDSQSHENTSAKRLSMTFKLILPWVIMWNGTTFFLTAFRLVEWLPPHRKYSSLNDQNFSVTKTKSTMMVTSENPSRLNPPDPLRYGRLNSLSLPNLQNTFRGLFSRCLG